MKKAKNKKVTEEINLSNKEQEIINLYNNDIIKISDDKSEVIEEFELVSDDDLEYDEYYINNDNYIYLSGNAYKATSLNLSYTFNNGDEIRIGSNQNDAGYPFILKFDMSGNCIHAKTVVTSISRLYENDEFEIVAKTNNTSTKYKRTKKIINIVFVIVIMLIIMVSTDIICVSKYNIGPFFAIPVKKYNDGGTKEYYGIGYKVIKYKQIQGRRDKEIGGYKLKYNTNPIDIDIIDLAIEFKTDANSAYKKYYKKFVRVTGNLKSVNKNENTITMSYEDDGLKYSINIKCNMETLKKELNSLNIGNEIVVIGTVNNYKENTSPTTIYLTNCFAEQ